MKKSENGTNFAYLGTRNTISLRQDAKGSISLEKTPTGIWDSLLKHAYLLVWAVILFTACTAKEPTSISAEIQSNSPQQSTDSLRQAVEPTGFSENQIPAVPENSSSDENPTPKTKPNLPQKSVEPELIAQAPSESITNQETPHQTIVHTESTSSQVNSKPAIVIAEPEPVKRIHIEHSSQPPFEKITEETILEEDTEAEIAVTNQLEIESNDVLLEYSQHPEEVQISDSTVSISEEIVDDSSADEMQSSSSFPEDELPNLPELEELEQQSQDQKGLLVNLDITQGDNTDVEGISSTVESQQTLKEGSPKSTRETNASPKTNHSLIAEPTNTSSVETSQKRVIVQGQIATAGKNQKSDAQEVTYDMPIIRNQRVKNIIHFYQYKKFSALREGVKRSGRYLPMIHRILKEEGLPLDLAYLAAIESNYNPRARSHMNAVGLWQFISSTGKAMGLRNNRWIDERKDPVKATRAAAKYLKHLYKRFGDWEHTLAAYNAGQGRVSRAIRYNKKRGRSTNYWSLRLPRETRGYVPAFMAATIIYKNRAEFNIDDIVLDSPMNETTMTLAIQHSPNEIAKRIGIPLKTILDHNPALYRGIPPLYQTTYQLYLPKEQRDTLTVSLEQNPKPTEDWQTTYATFLNRSSRMTHLLEKHGERVYIRIRRGDNLWDLAKKHNTTVYSLRVWNRLPRKHLLRIGQRLKIYLPTMAVIAELQKQSKRQKTLYQKSSNITKVRVRKGRTLSWYALRYRTTVKNLLTWNNLKKPEDLRAGQKIIVRKHKSTPVTTQKTVTHSNGAKTIRVRKGQTLSDIAQQFQVSVSTLMAWNGLVRATDLQANQFLIVSEPKKTVAMSSSVIAPTVPNSSHPVKIVVRSGDTLSEIAERFNTSVKNLMAWNGLVRAADLQANQALIVNLNQPRSHRVRIGDTLWNIARIYRTSVKKLIAVNELQSNYLQPNQTLIIPD